MGKTVRDYNAKKTLLKQLFSIHFATTLVHISSLKFLFLFWFPRKYVVRLGTTICLFLEETHTCRNRYGENTMLSTILVLRPMTSPYGWIDFACLLRNHPSQLSEMFWKTDQDFVEAFCDLALSNIDKELLNARLSLYLIAVYDNRNKLSNCSDSIC